MVNNNHEGKMKMTNLPI